MRSDVRYERSVDIEAGKQRVWDVLSDLEAWPRRIETVELVELLTPPPLVEGSRVRLKQPTLPEGTWDVTVWDAPTSFELRRKSRGGITSVVGHRVETLEAERSRLTLSLDMRGFVIPVVAVLSKGMIDRHLTSEVEGMKRACESPDT